VFFDCIANGIEPKSPTLERDYRMTEC
jgi:hypothetical protein